MRVAPLQQMDAVSDGDPRIASSPHWKSASLFQLSGAAFNLCLWFFLMFLMLSQLLTAVSNTTTSKDLAIFGQDPSLGLYSIPGQNDEPYSDRMIACVRRGKSFKAISLNDALLPAVIEDSSGSAVHGYRVVHRDGLILSESTKQTWTKTCRLLHSTLDGLFKACDALGYTNLTLDNLRIMDDLHSNMLKRIPNSLPVLILPFWDNGPSARYAIPSFSGQACIFRLNGQYEDSTQHSMYLYSVNRSVRENQTAALLNRPGGQWKNGWYEDTQGMRWYSDIVAKSTDNTLGLIPRYFDPSAGKEFVCQVNSECYTYLIPYSWGAELLNILHVTSQTSVAISNGTRFGLFLYRGAGVNFITCIYDFSALVSNASVVSLLFRWMLAMVALYRGYAKRVSNWHGTGIGCIANSSSFTLLPIAMLPRLKMILAAFFTIGCQFEGDQRALGDAWFVMYPSIVDFVLIYASLLNMIAKLLSRRMNDWVFPFTIVILSVMHYFRQMAANRLKFLSFGGRVTTLVPSDEFERLTSIDLFFPDVARRMSGNVPFIMWLKIAILALSILSLVFSESVALHSNQSRDHESCIVEQALAIRACNVGGIGRFSTHKNTADGEKCINVLSSYGLIRLGYLVVGGRYLMKTEDWLILSPMKHVRYYYSLWNHRIMVFQVQYRSDTKAFQISSNGRLVNINDPALNCIPWWDIDARPLL